jgi:hypothetical protein
MDQPVAQPKTIRLREALARGLNAGRAAARTHWLGALISVAAFVMYAPWARQLGVGCDPWAYLSQARLFLGQDVGLAGTLDPAKFPALVPLCYELVGRNSVPGMPPGFSLELAIGGLLGLEHLVSPFIGAVTVFLIYYAAQLHARRPIAWATALLWATTPIVIWGATQLMADLSAACGLLLAHVFLERARPKSAGVALGLSLGIRPTNALLLPSILFRRPGWPVLVQLVLGLAIGACYWVLFGLGRYVNSMFGMYSANARSVTYENWDSQLWFVFATTGVMFPLIVPLAIFAVLRAPKVRLNYVVWILTFVGFYVGWRYEYDEWWWTRHVLPAYPALTLLAAHGLSELWETVSKRDAKMHKLFRIGAAAALIGSVAWGLVYAESKGQFDISAREVWLRDLKKIRDRVGKQSLIASVVFSGPLRLYNGMESFRWDNDKAPELIDYALANGRSVYALIEPSSLNRHHLAIALQKRYAFSDVTRLQSLGGITLKRIRPPVGSPLAVAARPLGPRITVLSSVGIRGNPLVAVDGTVVADGMPWDAPGTIVLESTASVLTLELDLAVIEELRISADTNDSYRVESSLDGESFVDLGTLPPANRAGLSTRVVPLERIAATRYLRISPLHGDGSYSISEVAVSFGPWAPAITEVSGARGDQNLAVDGRLLKEGSMWNAPGTLILEKAGASITAELPDVPVDSIQILADANDVYRLDGSYDGKQWQEIDRFLGVAAFGQRLQAVALDPRHLWSMIRLTSVSGDGAFGISELATLTGEGRVLQPGSALAGDVVGEGWLPPPPRVGLKRWRYAARTGAVLNVSVAHAGRPYQMTLQMEPVEGLVPPHFTVLLNKQKVHDIQLDEGLSSYVVELPAERIRQKNVVELHFSQGLPLREVELASAQDVEVSAIVRRIGFGPPF